jgi:hypothetical protein
MRKLPCPLTDDELRERGALLVDTLQKKGRVDGKRKDVAKKYREAMKGLDFIVGVTSTAIADKQEVRDVECLEEKAFDRKLVVTTRKDTGEVVFTRPMTDEERQEKLPLNLVPIDGGKQKKGKKGLSADAVAAEPDVLPTPDDGASA